MRIITVLAFLLVLPAISYSNDTIKTDRIDAIKSKQTLDDYKTAWAQFNKEDPKTRYKYITIKFDSNYILHMFYAPDFDGAIDIFVSNDKGEIVLEQRVGMLQKKPYFDDYRLRDKSLLITYQVRTERCVGPGLSESIYERQIELFDGKQVTIFRTIGNVEAHNYGEKNAAYSDYIDQINESVLTDSEVILNYEYKIWKQTGDYRDESFVGRVKPDEQGKSKTYVRVLNNDLEYDSKRSDKFTSAQSNLIDLHFDSLKKSGYKKEVVKYQ